MAKTIICCLVLICFLIPEKVLSFVRYVNSTCSIHGSTATKCFADKYSQDSTIRLFIDVSALSKQQQEKLLSFQWAHSLEKGMTDTLVNTSKDIRQFVATYTNLKGKKHKDMVVDFAEIIKDINQLGDNEGVAKGELICAPVGCPIPDKTSSYSYVHQLDYVNANASTYIAGDHGLIPKTFQNETKSSVLDISLTADQFEELKNDVIGNVEYSKMFGESILRIALTFEEAKFPLVDENDVFSHIWRPSISKQLQHKLDSLTIDDFGEYHILDFFYDGDCSHGSKVVSVVKQRFNQFNLDSSFVKIRRIPVDFKKYPTAGLNMLRKYYQNSVSMERAWGWAAADALEKWLVDSIDKIGDKCIPSNVLRSYLCNSYEEGPDIISTSFYIMTYENVIPNLVDDSTTFITACLNEPDKTIEAFRYQDASTPKEQPLAGFFQSPNYGAIIVSSQSLPNTFDGMYSEDGRGVSTLGWGCGWDFSNVCDSPHKGASFAVPDIGAMLLIAKAYWRSKKTKITAREAKVRLLLSADIDTFLLGKFGSGGRPNVEKLLFTKGGVFQDIDGEIGQCQIKANAKIGSRSFKRGTSIDNVPGLAFVGDKIFCFSELSMSWSEIRETSIKIVIERDGKEELFTSLEALKGRYKHLINLNN